MNKLEQVEMLLDQVREKVLELLDYEDENIDQINSTELVILALNLLTYGTIQQEYNSPLGIVDTTKVSFMLDEEFEVPISENLELEYVEDED